MATTWEMLPCCVALSCRPKCPAIAGSLFSEHLVADIPRNCNRLPQLEIERDFSTSVEMTRWQTWGAYRHSNHIDRKLTLKPAEAGASSGPPMDVLLLSGDPDLSVLHLALHFEVLRFDGLNYFFRFVAFQTLLNFQLLSRVAQRRNCSIELFDIAQIDSTLRQFTNDNLAQTAQPRCVFRGQNDLFFLVQNFRLGVLKVETGGQFFACLV